ncbi:MAG: transcriptional repressor, partial [Alphaproteobacteria bacterium]|nr:transcriptional repressor [Alphaproteobacteria bacterium]
MMAKRPYTDSVNRLRKAKLRPTRQRLALARLL